MRTLECSARAMLLDSGLPPSFWHFAVEMSTHIFNRMPHRSLDYKIPLKLFASDRKLHLDKLKRFGCIACVLDSDPKTKFSKRATKTVLVGYSNSGYILWDPETNKFVTAANVRFVEKLVYKDDYKHPGADYIIQDSELQGTNSDCGIVFYETVPEDNANVEVNPDSSEATKETTKEKPKKGRKRKSDSAQGDKEPQVQIRVQPK